MKGVIVEVCCHHQAGQACPQTEIFKVLSVMIGMRGQSIDVQLTSYLGGEP